MKIVYDKDYRKLLSEQLKEQLMFLIKNNQEFLIIVNMDGVEFNPPLPEEIMSAFSKDMMPFAIAGYTFKSAYIENDTFIFEAGFGSENIGAMVYIEIDRIYQIAIEDNLTFINIPATLQKETPKDSFEVFKSKNKNKKFFNKS